jgi:hypothetical protein
MNTYKKDKKGKTIKTNNNIFNKEMHNTNIIKLDMDKNLKKMFRLKSIKKKMIKNQLLFLKFRKNFSKI